MGTYSPQQRAGTNGMAITSLVFAILSWLLTLILLIVNLIIIPLVTLATFGFGSLLYICTITISCISPIGWLVGAITGNAAKSQIRQTGAEGLGMAQVGTIMSVIGLVLTFLSICLIVSLPVLGVSIPILSDPSSFGY